MYKEFANNLIEKLEEYKYTNLVDRGNGLEHCEKIGIAECEGRDCLLCVWDEAEEIVRQFAEEYSKSNTAGSSPLLYGREEAMRMLEHCDYANEKELISIESALGFELTPWQISFIATGEMRRTGKTTAEAIRKYLINRGKTIDLIPTTMRESCEFGVYEYVMRTLESAGLGDIKINKIPKRHTVGILQ